MKPIGKIELSIEGITKEDTMKYQEILTVLISSGALGLKNGSATLHFDSEGIFQGVELDYWAFRRRKALAKSPVNVYDGRSQT